MSLQLDHIVFGADSLEQGVAYIAEKFGVEVPRGGEHLQMGTHNCVMSLAGACYFEIIACAPHLPAPDRPRWFDLDNPAQRAKLKAHPRLLTWVARTPDIRETLAKTSYNFGEVVHMHRGDLSWQMTIPPEGHLPLGGVCPTLIEWQDDLPPYASMSDLGCKLSRVILHSEDREKLTNVLQDIGAGDLVQLEKSAPGQPAISVELSTPRGLVLLD